jgi:citrate lyase subunit gamma (acyl carrier protein)
MDEQRSASAGKAQKGDALVTIHTDNGTDNGPLRLTITSSVQGLFGTQIEAVCRQVLQELGVVSGQIVVDDQQALDCVLRSRMRCAVQRLRQQGGLL